LPKISETMNSTVAESWSLSGWGRVLNSLASGGFVLEVDDHNFTVGLALKASWVPLAMLVISLIVAFVTMARLFCCSPKMHSNRGKSATVSFVWAGLSFGVAVVGLIIFLSTAQRGFGHSNDVLNELSVDVGNASTVASSLNMSVWDLQSNLQQLQVVCPDLPTPVKQSIDAKLQPVLAELETTGGDMNTYANQLGAISGEVDKLTSGRASDIEALSSAILSVPIIFVTLTCAFMTTILLGTSCLRSGSNCAKCQDIFFFKIGSVGLALTILIVAVISTAQLASGIAISSFCGDVDGNMMLVLNKSIGEGSPFYAEHGAQAYNATRYYVTGQGQNPFEVELNNASTKFGEVTDAFSKLQEQLHSDDVQKVCGNAFDGPVNAINVDLDNVENQTQLSFTLISRNETIYPLYSKAVHEAVCGEIINGLGWLSLFQFAVGVVCLPCLSCTVASFVHRRAYERRPHVVEGAEVNLV